MRRTPLLALAAAAALGTTLVGCGGDDSASGCTPASTVDVHAKDELKFDKTAYSAKKGCVEVNYINDGSVAHTLVMKGASDFSKLSIGKQDSGTVELDPGTYTIYCDISGHEAAGMKAELTIE